MGGPDVHMTPSSGRVRPPHMPEASPFSSVLARLPDLSPPRTKYTTSFGSLHQNPLASPAQANTFGFRPSGSQTPGGPAEGKVATFDLLGGTPVKSMPAEQLGSPRFDLQSPKFPLFQPSPKKPLDSLRSPPSVRLGDSTAAYTRSFSSPFGALLDGSSRSAPSPAEAACPSPAPHASAAAPQRQQQRFAALFAQGGSALDAALGTGDITAPAGLDPAYLSPLRPQSASGAPRSGSHPSGDAAGIRGAEQQPNKLDEARQREQQQQQQQEAAAMTQQEDAEMGAAAALAAAAGHSGAADTMPVMMAGFVGGSLEREDDDDEGDEQGLDDEEDEDYTASASFRRPPPRRRHVTGAGGPARSQLAQRPVRRRTLLFGAGAVSSTPAAAEEEVEATPLVHSTLPQSPMCQPVRMDVDMLLPIPKLRDPSSTSEDGSGSPMHRLRSSGYSLDSPAVQAAAHAAVAAALEASAGTGSGPAGSRRPARAAAAGAAAAAKAAAEAAGTPVQRRASSHLAPSSSGASLSSALPPLTPGEEGALPQAVFAGPKKCNCKKSKCLKLYCDCFANGGYCGANCSCVNCANKVENSELVRVQREAIKQRNPNAFVQKIEADAAQGGQHRRGCNCRKSHCMKKYCECFQAGVPCGEHCKCESCHNTAGHAARRPPGGGASKRARSSATVAAPQRTRQPSTRLSTGSAALSQQLKQAQAVAAASLQAAMAQATASMAGGSAADVQDEERPLSAGDQQPQGMHPPPVLFPFMSPTMLKGADAGASPLMIPIMLQQAAPSVPLHLAPPATAAPALAAFAAAAATDPSAAAAAAATGAMPSHITPVAALVGAVAAEPAAVAGAGAGPPGASAFSFHPSAPDGSGSSSGHSTPRAAGIRAAAAADDLAFSLDTPAAAIAQGGGSVLERLLPATTAADGMPGPPSSKPAGVRSTPTKRKPPRTMTAALM